MRKRTLMTLPNRLENILSFLYIKHLHIARVAGAASLRNATPTFIHVRLKLSTFGSFLIIFSRVQSEPL